MDSKYWKRVQYWLKVLHTFISALVLCAIIATVYLLVSHLILMPHGMFVSHLLSYFASWSQYSIIGLSRDNKIIPYYL